MVDSRSEPKDPGCLVSAVVTFVVAALAIVAVFCFFMGFWASAIVLALAAWAVAVFDSFRGK